MPDPRLVGLDRPLTANEFLLDRAIRHAVFVVRFRTQVGNELVGELEGLLSQTLARAISAVEGIQGRGFAVNSASRARVRRLLRRVADAAGVKYRDLRKALVEEMGRFARAEAGFQVTAFRQSLPEGLTLGFTTPSSRALSRIITQRPILFARQSGFVGSFFQTMERSFLREVEGAVNTGLANGETAREIGRRLSGVRGSEGVFGKARRDLMTVARTTVSHVSNQAREVAYAANADVVKGVQFVATLDARTTPICRSLDGQVFKFDEGDRPPMHHQCRSVTVPVLKSFQELGLGDRFQEAPETTRAALDGQAPTSLTYTEWLRRQPRRIQDLALGPRRAELFRSGEVMSMRDLLDPLNRPLTLDQLMNLEGIAA